MTHAELVTLAAKWLGGRCGCRVVLTEVGGKSPHGEKPDVIGWSGTVSYVIECKISRSDFFADRKKPFRLQPERGMGYRRWYLAPVGLLTPADVMACGWGLLEHTGKKMLVRHPSTKFPSRSQHAEVSLLYTALQRVQYRITVPLREVVAWDAYGTHVDVIFPEQHEDTEPL